MQSITTKRPEGSRENLSNEIKLFTSKRKSRLQHLQGLLAKRARLTQEILFLKKSDKETTQNYRNRIKKQNIQIKESGILCEDGFDQEVELSKHLRDLDAGDEILAALLTSYSKVELDDRLAKHGIRTLEEYVLRREDYKNPLQAAIAESSIFFSGK